MPGESTSIALTLTAFVPDCLQMKGECVCACGQHMHTSSELWKGKRKKKKTQVFILTLVYHLGDYLIATIASF